MGHVHRLHCLLQRLEQRLGLLSVPLLVGHPHKPCLRHAHTARHRAMHVLAIIRDHTAPTTTRLLRNDLILFVVVQMRERDWTQSFTAKAKPIH